MIAKFIRTGRRCEILHVAGCPRCNWLQRLLKRARPWAWADDQPAWRILSVAMQLHLKPCPLCRPMDRIHGVGA